MFFQKIKCFFGMHAWGKETSYWSPGSSFKDMKKTCMACGKTEKWVEEYKRDEKDYMKVYKPLR